MIKTCTKAPLKGYHIGVITSNDDTTICANLMHKKSTYKKDKPKLPI